MTNQSLSRSDIVQILLVLFTIAVTLIDEYLGLGYVGIFFLILFLFIAVIFSRQSKFFPYLLAIIGIAIGFSSGLFLSANGSIGRMPNQTDNGVRVPADVWILKSQVIDNSEKTTGKYHQAIVALQSVQSDNTFGSPRQKASYVLTLPSLMAEINGAPLQGIKSTVFIVPLNNSYESELIYCNYTMTYDNKAYTSSTHFVPLNSPTTLVWDFTSQPDIDFDSLPDEIKSHFNTAKEYIFQDTNGFVSFSRRYPETWQYQVMENKNAVAYNPEKIQQIALECGVSATQGYVGGNPGDVFNFQGTFIFSDIVIYPFLGKPAK